MNLSRSRRLTALIAWLAGAATAVAVGLLALSSIDFGLSSHPAGQPLGELAEVASPATTAEPTPTGSTESPSPSPSATRSADPRGIERTITSVGGTVVARCIATAAYLVSWSPAQGYHSDDVRRGPAPTASVGFENSVRKYTVSVTCVKGVPQGTVRPGDR